jgi:hypothetical protein
MNWNQAMKEERAALMRIVALLRALAGLAELAGSRSPAVRGFVLWILRRAEAAAQDFVAGGQDTPMAPMPVEPPGARPADALRLAINLRRLARQLECQARLVLGLCRERSPTIETPLSGVMTAMRDVATTLSVPTASAWPIPHPAPDTS